MVAEQGADYMYTGPWAEKLIALVGTHETRVRQEPSARLWGANRDGSFPGVVVPETGELHGASIRGLELGGRAVGY